MGKRLWDLAKSRIEIGTILPGHRHKVIPPRAEGEPLRHTADTVTRLTY